MPTPQRAATSAEPSRGHERRGAILGFGRVAEAAHAPAWSAAAGLRIVAVADERPERLAAARDRFPNVRTYGTAEALFDGEPELEFVDIATPPFLHGRQILAALERGCHVLCEKPLALAREELDAVSARAGSRAVLCVHNWAHAPIFRKAQELLRAGAIGTPRHAELHVLRREPAADASSAWRTDPRAAGGGILVDHGWHNFYLLQRLLGGAAPASVSARLSIPAAGGVDREAFCAVAFPEATAGVYLTWNAAARSNWGVVYGSTGTLELRDDELFISGGAAPDRLRFPEKLSRGSAHPEWFAAMLGEFRAELDDPAVRGRNLREAQACLEILLGAYESHRRLGAAVALGRRAGLVPA